MRKVLLFLPNLQNLDIYFDYEQILSARLDKLMQKRRMVSDAPLKWAMYGKKLTYADYNKMRQIYPHLEITLAP